MASGVGFREYQRFLMKALGYVFLSYLPSEHDLLLWFFIRV